MHKKIVASFVISRYNAFVASIVAPAVVCVALAMLISGCVSSDSRSAGKPTSDKALIHAQLARGYMQQKQYAVAKNELEQALKLNPSHSVSNYVMGLLMLELKQYEEAEKHLRRAVRSDPENASAAHDLAMFLCQMNKERESITYFETAATNPFFKKSELSYMRAGECLARIDDPRAERYLKNALKVNPQLRPALFRLAMIKYEAESYFSARAYIERYIAITKIQPASLLLAYKIESRLDVKDVADKYRMQLLEEFSGSKEANYLRKQNRD